MKLYLHTGLKWCEEWDTGFEAALEKLKIEYSKVDIFNSRERKQIPPNSLFLGRINESGRHAKSFYGAFSDALNGRTWPSKEAMYYYDDKWLQTEFFRRNNLPTPPTMWVESTKDAQQFVMENNLTFPLVMKQKEGASSKKVALINNLNETSFPCILQEFCQNNTGDYRYTKIGNRVFGFFRHNRANDFRASGSGQIKKLNILDSKCIELVSKIPFDCMAYDLVLNKENWTILEMSYTFRVASVSKYSDFYYDIDKKEYVKEITDPCFLIVKNFINKHIIKI